MASKNLLPVVALCGALATGTPVAAWATPVMADSLPAALSSASNPSSAIACKRFFDRTGCNLNLGMPSS